MTFFERYPSLQTAWEFVKYQDETVLIMAGSFAFVVLVFLIFGRRKPIYGYEAENPLMKANNLFLKIYPLCILACWVAIFAGFALIGIGVASYLGHISMGPDFASFPPLELALYSCAIPFGAAMSIWRLKGKKTEALARIAEHTAASKDAGLIKSY